MTPQTELLEIVGKVLKEKLNLELTFDTLSETGGLYAEAAPGFTETVYYNKDKIKILPVRFFCKSKQQKYCMETLSVISNYFQDLHQYPNGTTFQWLDAVTTMEPYKTKRNEDGQYLYSFTMNCKIYN